MIAYIRSYREQDFSRLLEIDRICFEPGIAYDGAALHHFLSRPGSLVRVLAPGGDIVGFGVAGAPRHGARTGHIVTLDLLPAARGMGWGRLLLQELEQLLAGRGAKTALLEVDVRNTQAVGFYSHMGYRRVRTLRHYYAPGRDAALMARPLAAADCGTQGAR